MHTERTVTTVLRWRSDACGGAAGAALALVADHRLGLEAVPGACTQPGHKQLLGAGLPLILILGRGERSDSG